MGFKKCMEDAWFGTVTVGERGQIVIPADARKKLSINHGDKLFLISHPSEDGLMLFKIDAMREFMNQLAAGLNMAEANTDTAKSEDDSEEA